MAIKLAVLKSGEHVISDIQQLVDHNDKVISLVFSNPYVVNLITPDILFGEESSKEIEHIEHKVAFYPWIVLSNDKKIEVDPTWVVSVVEPNEMIKSSYQNKMIGSVEGIKSDEDRIIDNFEIIAEESNG